ncbi:MAG: Mth938-like domain-containing protein [Proteobacteria bacterium]|nr:Mth938-like domain-containing protein [Pseudomonadota bacterium]MDE3207983.1 Mth938-like domain-containing protein [Pseudomonadota bacterium]
MKLHLTNDPTTNMITGYGKDYVLINQERHDYDLLVLPHEILPWRTECLEELTGGDFETVAHLDPEVVLVGTGQEHRFVHPKLYATLSKRQIGVEIMANGAACRTYNILVGEGRRVACALILNESTFLPSRPVK